MSDKLLETLTIGGAVVVGMVIMALLRRGQVNWRWFVLTLAAYGIYEASYWIGASYPLALFESSAWNWSAKIYATFAVLGLIVFLPGISRISVGLTLVQSERQRLAWLVVVGYCALFVFLALRFPPAAFDGDWDTLAFQLTMPSIDEELFFRGLFMVMIDKTYGISKQIVGASLGYGALLSSVIFGLIHAVGFDDSQFSFSLLSFTIPGLVGLLACWLKQRTGSLLAPILLHSFGNSIFLIL